MIPDRLAIIVLTYNCESIIGETLAQARKLSKQIYVVDSHSKDSTLDVVSSLGANIIQRPFVNYGEQRNWAISNFGSECDWQLHLDADEVLDNVAIDSILSVISSGGANRNTAYMIRRVDYFLGQRLRHSGVNPWHLRLFPSGGGRCEDRLYDQHFVTELKTAKLKGSMHDKNSLRLSDWIDRHNRWSDLEAKELENPTGSNVLKERLFGDPRERTRWIKIKYYKMPAVLRTVLYFTYRYIFRLGILDGQVGFYFAVFQAFWFKCLIDAKIFENKLLADVGKMKD